jgi:hypothetical protein
MQFIFAILYIFFNTYIATAYTPPNIILDVQPNNSESFVTFLVPIYSDYTFAFAESLDAGIFNKL